MLIHDHTTLRAIASKKPGTLTKIPERYVLTVEHLKGNSGRNKSWAQLKEREKCKKNEPSPTSMRQMVLEICQEFGQDGHRHFAGFQPHFHLNMTSQTHCWRTMRKSKCNISGVLCLICLKLCRLLGLGKEISLAFKFRCYGNQNQNDCLLLKKQKVYCLSKSDVQK